MKEHSVFTPTKDVRNLFPLHCPECTDSDGSKKIEQWMFCEVCGGSGPCGLCANEGRLSLHRLKGLRVPVRKTRVRERIPLDIVIYHTPATTEERTFSGLTDWVEDWVDESLLKKTVRGFFDIVERGTKVWGTKTSGFFEKPGVGWFPNHLFQAALDSVAQGPKRS